MKNEFGRPTKKKKTLANLLKVNRDLIDEARFRGYDQKYDRVLSDLEILGELQHFRAATCLIDFTFFPEIALRFACQPSSEEGKMVSLVRSLQCVMTRRLKRFAVNGYPKKKIENFFETDESGKYPIYRWQPENITNRVERQEGIFLFGGGKIDIEDECYIDEVTKVFLLGGLRSIYNIHEEVLFPDFDGFFYRNAHNIPYNLDPTVIGYRAYRRGHYDKAIDSFTEALRHKPDDIELYCRRGRTRLEIRFYAEALKDFERVLNLNAPGPYFHSLTYWRRGCLKAEMGQYNEAREDYQIGLQLAQEINRTDIIARIEEDIAKLES